MRIGVDVSKAVGPRDGIGVYTLELARALGAEAAAGDEILLYGLFHPVPEDELRARLDPWPASFRFRGPAPPAGDGLDVFHATTWIVPPGLEVPGLEVPVVFTCYDLTFLTHAACHTLENKVHCLEGVLEARLVGATFLAISHATAAELRRWLEVPDERLEVVYPAPAARFRPLASEEARARVARRFGVERPYVLAVGTLEPRKNLRRLLEAYGGLPEATRAAHPLLVAGGGGWGGERLEDLVARRLELAGVRLLGRVDDDDLVALYGAAALFAYPSLAEGFGLPVIEAMACGAPVVTSDRSATAEVAGAATGEAAARLVDPEDAGAIRDALAGLLADPEERRRLSELGRARAAEFSWRRSAREIFGLYRRLAAEPAAADVEARR